MRRTAPALGTLLLTFVIAGSALGGNGRLSFTTGDFVVTCTSTGQVCKPAKRLEFTLPRPGTLRAVTYTTAKAHCSAVRVFVLRGRRMVAKLPRLDAGDATATAHTAVRLPDGDRALRFQAKGFTGGCNAGQLGSWGGKITIRVKLD
jgi:hypothetical protein